MQNQRLAFLFAFPSALLSAFLSAFLLAFLFVLLGPLIKFFRQGHFQFLQTTNLGNDEGVLAASAQQGPNPQGEDAFEFRLARQPVVQQIDQPQQIPILRRVLEADDGGDQVAHRRQFLLRIVILVDEQVLEPGEIVGHQAGYLGQQGRQIHGCGPGRVPVVEDDGQHRWQRVSRFDLLAADQVLIEQADVDQHPHRHEGIDGALELDEDVEVEPVLAGPDPPDHVVTALAQVVRDIAGGDLFQGGVIQPVQPGIGDEAQHQIPHHLGGGEEQFVASVVVLGHGEGL